MGRRAFAAAALAVLFAAGAMAQGGNAGAPQLQAAPPAATAVTGAVSGRVLCGDTQRPARFADVTLIPVQQAGDDDGPRGGFGRRGSGRTDLDGNYLITNLPAGDYYINATATGYVSSAALVLQRASSTADQASLLAQLPQVHVGANATVQASVTLERGAVIAGRMQWDDGSPAAGVQVQATLSTQQNPVNGRGGGNPFGGLGFGGGGAGFTQTDDRGNFRITGLASGAYLVRATFSAPGPQITGAGGQDPRFGNFARTVAITLYAPGKLRRADAQTITLAAGEERADVAFVADLHALHSVSGRVSSASTPQVGSGQVRLVDTQDNSLARVGQVAPDGSFTIPYVPAGTYNLSTYASSSTPQGGGFGGRRGGENNTSTPATTFTPLQQTLTVVDADMTGLNLTVTPATSATTASR